MTQHTKINLLIIIIIIFFYSCKQDKKTGITLPFSEEHFESNQKIYPYISKNKQQIIQNLIINQSPENSEIDGIIQINNKMNFDTYVYFVSGDSSFSELINVKGEKIISTVSVGYQYPGYK